MKKLTTILVAFLFTAGMAFAQNNTLHQINLVIIILQPLHKVEQTTLLI